MRQEGFRRVRRQVCRRIERRRRELGLAGLPAYRVYLEEHANEWVVLDALCRVTISRFYRDRGVFAFLEGEVLPALAWELGLASRFPGLDLHVLATDADEAMLARARPNPDRSVTISLFADGEQLLTATDRGLGGPPLTAPGRVGIRGDNADFMFDDFRVRAVTSQPARRW